MKTTHLKAGAIVEIEPGTFLDRAVVFARVRSAGVSSQGSDEVDALMGAAQAYRRISRELEQLAADAARGSETSARMFNGFDAQGIAVWVDSGNWCPDRDHGGRHYTRTGKIGRLRIKDRMLGGSLGEPIAEYESADKNRIWINLDGEVVAENA